MKCSVSRILVSSRLDAQRPLPRWTAKHIAGCGDCQDFQERAFIMDAALATHAETAPSPAAEKRVHWLGMGLVFAGAVAAMFLWLATAPQKPVAHTDTQEDPVPSAVTQALVGSLAELADAPVAPMERELALLRRDGERGVRHLWSLTGLDGL